VESDGKVVTHGRTPTRNARIARQRSIHTNRNSLRRAKTPISTRQSIILSIFAGDANSLGITVEMMLTIDREGGLRKMQCGLGIDCEDTLLTVTVVCFVFNITTVKL
jgi:hypothetical protein